MKKTFLISLFLIGIVSLTCCKQEKSPLVALNEKIIGSWHEKITRPGSSNDSVVFYTNGEISALLHHTLMSYSLVTIDTMQINGPAPYDTHRTHFTLYGDTEMHIDNFGVSLIGIGYTSIVLIKN
jgi:hypothetical protein